MKSKKVGGRMSGLCMSALVIAVSFALCGALLAQAYDPSRYFDITSGKVVVSPYESLAISSDGSQAACAQLCQASPNDSAVAKRCRAFSVYPDPRSDKIAVCMMSNSDKTTPNMVPNRLVQTGIPKKPLDDFVIADAKSIEGAGAMQRSDVDTLNKCASRCTLENDCNSFSFNSGDNRCTHFSSHRFATGVKTGVISGVNKAFRMRVQAVYLVPDGQTERPNATAAITQALRLVQEHYGRQLGRTFVLETPTVTVMRTEKSADLFKSSKDNALPSGFEYAIHTLALKELGEDYFLRKNLVFFVIEGLEGTSYGTSGTVVISKQHWEPFYKNYIEEIKTYGPVGIWAETLIKATNFVAWSHELGHALGLRHLDEVDETTGKPSACNPPNLTGFEIMLSLPKAASLFAHPFVDWERKRLRGENINDGPYCSFRRPMTSEQNLRPVSESYFQLAYPFELHGPAKTSPPLKSMAPAKPTVPTKSTVPSKK